MPLPLIIGIAAGIAGVAGVKSGIDGAVKMKKASDTSQDAKQRNEANTKRLESANNSALKQMDALGKYEMGILFSFKKFSDTFEKIKNRPSIAKIAKDEFSLPEFSPEAVKEAATGAAVLLGGIGGAALGTAGGFAAAGATTAAVMALGTASTGTAIASLSGAAATNATLAALGGGSLAAGGGGMALGTAVLGGASLGVGLLVGGLILNFTGSKLSDDADKAWSAMLENEVKIDEICSYLRRLEKCAAKYLLELKKVNRVYSFNYLTRLKDLVNCGRVDYAKYDKDEKLLVENTCLLVALLYKMCKVELVKKAENEDAPNTVNAAAVNRSIAQAEGALSKIKLHEKKST